MLLVRRTYFIKSVYYQGWGLVVLELYQPSVTLNIQPVVASGWTPRSQNGHVLHSNQISNEDSVQISKEFYVAQASQVSFFSLVSHFLTIHGSMALTIYSKEHLSQAWKKDEHDFSNFVIFDMICHPNNATFFCLAFPKPVNSATEDTRPCFSVIRE